MIGNIVVNNFKKNTGEHKKSGDSSQNLASNDFYHYLYEKYGKESGKNYEVQNSKDLYLSKGRII